MPPKYSDGRELHTHDRQHNTESLVSITAAHVASKTSAPAAFVSLLWPSSRRRCWWYLVRCSLCGAPHLGRARELADVTRTRKLPCGHRVQVVVARTYGRPGAAA
jgi:hypothetical protein